MRVRQWLAVVVLMTVVLSLVLGCGATPAPVKETVVVEVTAEAEAAGSQPAPDTAAPRANDTSTLTAEFPPLG